jgi:hypothetical protein
MQYQAATASREAAKASSQAVSTSSEASTQLAVTHIKKTQQL